MTGAIWAIVPAAGRSRRFGGEIPKQYQQAAGAPLLSHTLDALVVEPRIAGVVVAISESDPHWPGWSARAGKPIHACIGGVERADSVLAALRHLDGMDSGDALVLVHDAARPNLDARDLGRLIDAAVCAPDGAILAAPVRDTLKKSGEDGCISSTQPRDGLWRALTPQAFRLARLRDALQACRDRGIVPTDEAMAMELHGARPRLVEGREDNIKVTTPADLALVEFLLTRRRNAP